MIYDIKRSGERIRRLRIQYGYTQEQLAGKLNIDRSLISHVEAGKRGCSVDLLVRFSDLFNVSLDLLILGKEKSGLSNVWHLLRGHPAAGLRRRGPFHYPSKLRRDVSCHCQPFPQSSLL